MKRKQMKCEITIWRKKGERSRTLLRMSKTDTAHVLSPSPPHWWDCCSIHCWPEPDHWAALSPHPPLSWEGFDPNQRDKAKNKWNVRSKCEEKGWWQQNTLRIEGRLLTYLHLLLDEIVVQSKATLILTNGQHLPLIHHFNGRDLILIRRW